MPRLGGKGLFCMQEKEEVGCASSGKVYLVEVDHAHHSFAGLGLYLPLCHPLPLAQQRQRQPVSLRHTHRRRRVHFVNRWRVCIPRQW